MVGRTALEVFRFLAAVVLPLSHSGLCEQPLVDGEGYSMVVTASICVNRVARRLAREA